MSAETVIAIGYVSVVAVFTAAIYRLMRRIPQAARQRSEVDLAVCQIWDTPYPDLDAGLARLLADIRDEQQQKGD